MNLIRYLFLIILILNSNSFASLSRLRPLARAINTKAVNNFMAEIKSVSGEENEKLNCLQNIMDNKIAILKLDPKEHNKLIYDVAQVKTYLEKTTMCEKSIEELCQQQLIKTIDNLNPEIKALIIEKVKEDYQSMPQEELSEAIKKSEKILSIILPLGVGLAAIIPSCWYIYIIDLISG